MSVMRARQGVISALLEKKHPQQPLLTAWDFNRFASERELSLGIGDSTLETWDRLGIFCPIIKVRHPWSYHLVLEQLPDGAQRYDLQPMERQPTDEEIVVKLYDAPGFSSHTLDTWRERRSELVICPSRKTFRPWKEHKDGHIEAVTPYYHPMQLFALRKVYEAQRTVFEFPAFDCWEKPWLRQRLQIEKELKSAVTALRRKETALLKLLRLLLLIEDRYLPEMVGMIKGYGGRSDGNQSWYAWKDAFDAGRSLKESGLTLEDVRELRREYAQSGWLVDPNREWFTLLNHSLASHRGKLKGKALLAWDYYQVAEILGRFLKDVTDEVQPHIDDLVTGTGGWKKNVYGIAADEFDYQSGSSLTSVLRYFGLDPRTRVLLLVEGETEMAFTKVWFERQRLLAQSLRINIVNLAGFASLTHRMTKELLRHARDDKACTVIAVDGDVNVRDHLNTLLEDNLIDGIVDSGTITAQNGLPIGAVVWESCFEDANFSPDELCEAWKIVTKPSKQNRGAADNAVAAAILSAKSQVTSRPVGSFVKALSSAATQEGLTFNKPEVGRALAERYWDTERPYCILLAKMVQIAQFLNTGRYSAPAPGAADETGAQFRRIIE